MQDQLARRATAGLLAVSVAALSACSTSRVQTASAAGSITPLNEPTVTIPALPASDVAMLRGMSDANILDHLATSDSLEIAMARVAEQRTKNGAITDFARQMIADHSTSLRQDHEIARQPNLSMQLTPGDTSAITGFRELDSLTARVPTEGFDRDYIMSQIEMHQHVIAELQTLRDVAQSSALRQHVTELVPIVERHLRRAEQIASSLGYTKTGA